MQLRSAASTDAARMARRDWFNRTAPRYPPEEGMAIGSYELVYQVRSYVADPARRAVLLRYTRARSGCTTMLTHFVFHRCATIDAYHKQMFLHVGQLPIVNGCVVHMAGSLVTTASSLCAQHA